MTESSGQDAATQKAGTRLGKYWLIAKLGYGGMADVYLATARGPSGFHKLSVLKVLQPQLCREQHFITMFLDEARLAARLNHPNVVQTYEVSSEGDLHFLAMEYLEGQSLYRVLKALREQGGGLELNVHLRALCDALAALHYAHELTDYDGTPLHVVHRDVSPHNVFVTYDGQIKLLDFGIAKALTSVAETSPGVLKGKITYMAPEQACGEPVDRRADVFAVGVMLWEAVVGRRMWSEADGNVLHRLINGKIPTPSSVLPDVPADIEQVVTRALAYDAKDRFATAVEMRSALQGLLDRLGRPSDDRLAKIVCDLFAKERAEIRAVIDAQLRLGDGAGGPPKGLASLPVLDSGNSLSSANSMDAPTRISRIETRIEASATAPPPRQNGRSRKAIGGVIAAAALASVAFALGARKIATSSPPRGSEAPNTQLPLPLAAAAPPPVAAAVSKIALQLSASPREAHILVDGAAVASNPYTAVVPADDQPHVIRVEAPGYIPTSRALRFQNDVTLSVELEKEEARGGKIPPATRAVDPRVAPRAPAESRPSPAPAPSGPPAQSMPGSSKPLDWNDPWGK